MATGFIPVRACSQRQLSFCEPCRPGKERELSVLERGHQNRPVQIPIPTLTRSFRQKQAIVASCAVQGKERLVRVCFGTQGVRRADFERLKRLLQVPLQHLCLA